MAGNEDFEIACQVEYGPFLTVLSRILGTIAADNDARTMTWLCTMIATLVQDATERMANPPEGDGGDSGGSSLPIQ
jgi:hypothetical protein